jgi:hypothetical protein
MLLLPKSQTSATNAAKSRAQTAAEGGMPGGPTVALVRCSGVCPGWVPHRCGYWDSVDAGRARVLQQQSGESRQRQWLAPCLTALVRLKVWRVAMKERNRH